MFNAPLEIPNYAGWPEQTLENMCSVISRGTAPVYVEHSNVLAIGQRCISTSGFVPSFARPHSDRDQRNVLQPEIGDVLLNSTGTGTIGRSCVFNSADNFIVDGHVTLLRASPNKFRGEWLNAVLQTWWVQKHLERFCYAGSTNQLELSKSQLSATSIPVPSINEQDEFIKILRVLNSTIHQTEAIIEKLKQVKQGLLHDLLTRGVDANGELRPSYEQAPELYQASPLGWIPRGWNITSLGTISQSSVIGPFGSNLVAADYRPEGVPIVFVRDISQSGFEWKSNIYVTKSKAIDLAVHNVISGDILATKMGLPPCVSTVYPDEFPAGIITADILRFRVDKNIYRPEWISNCINESSTVKQIEAITAGVTRPKVTLRDTRNLLLRVPPITEQDSILERIKSIGRKIHLEKNTVSKLAATKSALTDDLLTGRVRVTPLLPPELSA